VVVSPVVAVVSAAVVVVSAAVVVVSAAVVVVAGAVVVVTSVVVVTIQSSEKLNNSLFVVLGNARERPSYRRHVRLSVRLSHADTNSKLMIVGACSFVYRLSYTISQGNIPSHGFKRHCDG